MRAERPLPAEELLTLTVPQGWKSERSAHGRVLSPPEPDLKIALFEDQALTAEAAVRGAWAALHEDALRSLEDAPSQPGHDGWDELRVFSLDDSVNPSVRATASAYRKGERWVALLLEASNATLEKRLAGVNTVTESVRPKGASKESFAGKTAHVLDAERIKALTDFVETGTSHCPPAGMLAFQSWLGAYLVARPTESLRAILPVEDHNTSDVCGDDVRATIATHVFQEQRPLVLG